MNAFLVIVAILFDPFGNPTPITIKLPWESMETCKAYLDDPTPILSNPRTTGRANCEEKKPDEKKDGKPV